MSDSLRGRWAVLCDGAVYVTPYAHDAESAARYALMSSRNLPSAAVASCRIGDARSLRRFEAGREVLP